MSTNKFNGRFKVLVRAVVLLCLIYGVTMAIFAILISNGHLIIGIVVAVVGVVVTLSVSGYHSMILNETRRSNNRNY
jgi:hypothetical protein